MAVGQELRDAIPIETAVDVGEVAGYDLFIDRHERSLTGAIERYDRVDLRHLDTYTIDPPQAHEYDDALSVEVRQGGDGVDGYTAWVHVADVPAMVPEHSILDRHARDNGRTFYYDTGADHMLPQQVLGEVSLRAGEDRPANTVEMRFDGDAELSGWNIYRSVIRTDANLSFEEANEYLATVRINDELEERLYRHERLRNVLPGFGYDGPVYEGMPEREQRMVDDLEHLHVLSSRLAGDRRSSWGDDRTPAYRTVEEFMIHANHLAGMELMERGEGLYRVHGTPAGWSDRVAAYLEQAGMDGVAEEVRAADGVDDVIALQREVGLPFLFKEAAEEEGQAYYSIAPRGHEALGFDVYAPLTAPARRYEDNVNWRVIHGETALDHGDMAGIALELNKQIRPSTFADEDAEVDALIA